MMAPPAALWLGLLLSGRALSLETPKVAPAAWTRIRRGRVHVEDGFISKDLCARLRADALALQAADRFRSDGLYELGKARAQQGFDARSDRQTYDAGWDSAAGDGSARADLARTLECLRREARDALSRPTMGTCGAADELTYNFYAPGASLRRHIDESHEETKGRQGWLLPTRRSLTWLLYLNDHWEAADGGALRLYERRGGAAADDVGSTADGDVQVGWVVGPEGAAERPVFLGEDEGGALVCYDGGGPLSPPVAPPAPRDLAKVVGDPSYAPVVGARDAAADPAPPRERPMDVLPVEGRLVLFDSVSVPHEVLAILAARPRVAATGWFHERLPGA